jgi:drug/metabolite transporter (DMT)-like permease
VASNSSTPAFLAMAFGVFALPLGGVIMEIRHRRKLKRAYWIVPILGFALLLIAGCGGYGNSGSKQPNPTPQTQSAQASTIVTLTVQ